MLQILAASGGGRRRPWLLPTALARIIDSQPSTSEGSTNTTNITNTAHNERVNLARARLSVEAEKDGTSFIQRAGTGEHHASHFRRGVVIQGWRAQQHALGTSQQVGRAGSHPQAESRHGGYGRHTSTHMARQPPACRHLTAHSSFVGERPKADSRSRAAAGAAPCSTKSRSD